MNEVRIGVIGIGNMGSAHLNCIGSGAIQGLRLTCACDCQESRLNFCKKQFPKLSLFTDYKELIQSKLLDAVLIAVPHPLHAEIAEAALKEGLHVLVEKPVDVSASKARRLNQIAADSNRIFAIMFNQRTNPLFQRAREIVQSGQLGTLKRSVWLITNWYRTQHYYESGGWRATWSGEGGGVLLNQAPHNLDLWQWICGMPSSVVAFCNTAKYHRIEVEDEATILTQYENGASGVFITSTGEYPGTNRLELSGSLGKIIIENGTLKWWRLKESERDYCFSSDSNSGPIETEYIEEKQNEKESGHAGILQNFTNAILYQEKLLSPGSDGIYELSLSNMAYLSQWTQNQKISYPFDEALFDQKLFEHAMSSRITGTKESDQQYREYSERWQVRW